jgi:hypothetical protein
MKLREGQNIKIVEDGDDLFISAPTINKMVMKHGPFTIQGESVEILAGEHVKISSTHPDKLAISVNIDKEKARIAELEQRIVNLEKVILSILKSKPSEQINEHQS